MSHRRDVKNQTKTEKKIEEFEERLKKTEEFLQQLFGVDPNTMNFQFLLNELRTSSEQAHQFYERGKVLETFILENNLKEQFEAWRKKKVEEQEAQNVKLPPEAPHNSCQETAGSGSPVSPPDP